MKKESSRPTVAILSMQRVVNFGSVLQAYSLKALLQEVSGKTIAFMDVDENNTLRSQGQADQDPDYSQKPSYPAGLRNKAKRWCFGRLSGYNKRLIKRFMQRQLLLDATEQSYDAVVVGSDEVFNHAKGVRLQLHGQIPQGKKLFTYAAACGTARAEDILPQDRERVFQAMANFSAVSVRDTATEQYVKQLYNGPVEHHLDPVLVGPLWRRTPRKVPLKNYLLVYAYGQRIRTAQEIQAIQAYARKHGLKTVAMGGSQFWTNLYIPADPMRLLDYFHYARCVVTDTFHGAVFSVLCEKPFAVIIRQSNRQKITGLLEDLSLQNRALQDPSQLEEVLYLPVDHKGIRDKLTLERQRSAAYLKEQLGVFE